MPTDREFSFFHDEISCRSPAWSNCVLPLFWNRHNALLLSARDAPGNSSFFLTIVVISNYSLPRVHLRGTNDRCSWCSFSSSIASNRIYRHIVRTEHSRAQFATMIQNVSDKYSVVIFIRALQATFCILQELKIIVSMNILDLIITEHLPQMIIISKLS